MKNIKSVFFRIGLKTWRAIVEETNEGTRYDVKVIAITSAPGTLSGTINF